MTQIVSFFERPLVGIATAAGAFVTQPIGSIIESTQPIIGYITVLAGAVTAVCIGVLWLRKLAITFAGDLKRRPGKDDPHS